MAKYTFLNSELFKVALSEGGFNWVPSEPGNEKVFVINNNYILWKEIKAQKRSLHNVFEREELPKSVHYLDWYPELEIFEEDLDSDKDAELVYQLL